MTSSFIYLLILLYATTLTAAYGEIILTEDREYEVIKFKIPHEIWQKAISPTPILKSSVTVTLPVSVEEDFNDVEEVQDESEASPVVNEDETILHDDEAVVPAATDSPVPAEPIAEEDPGTVSSPENQNPIFGQAMRFPCSCVDGQCGCCTGTIMERFNMKACGNISFIPEDFVFDVKMSVNNNTVVHRRVSASDPPPICFNPRRVPFVQVCAEISNIRIRNRNAFACLDINANIADFPIYSASFRCFGLGTSGVQTNLKPKPQTNDGPKPINLFGNGGGDDGGDILENAAEQILGGDGPGGDPGPFQAIGDAVGGLFGRKRVKTKLGSVINRD